MRTRLPSARMQSIPADSSLPLANRASGTSRKCWKVTSAGRVGSSGRRIGLILRQGQDDHCTFSVTVVVCLIGLVPDVAAVTVIAVLPVGVPGFVGVALPLPPPQEGINKVTTVSMIRSGTAFVLPRLLPRPPDTKTAAKRPG